MTKICEGSGQEVGLAGMCSTCGGFPPQIPSLLTGKRYADVHRRSVPSSEEKQDGR